MIDDPEWSRVDTLVAAIGFLVIFSGIIGATAAYGFMIWDGMSNGW